MRQVAFGAGSSISLLSLGLHISWSPILLDYRHHIRLEYRASLEVIASLLLPSKVIRSVRQFCISLKRTSAIPFRFDWDPALNHPSTLITFSRDNCLCPSFLCNDTFPFDVHCLRDISRLSRRAVGSDPLAMHSTSFTISC